MFNGLKSSTDCPALEFSVTAKPKESKVPKNTMIVVLLLAATTSSGYADSDFKTMPEGPRVAMGLAMGSSGGFEGAFDLLFSALAPGLPLDLRLGAGYASVNSGDPVAARRVFINDATNGVPQRSGRKWDYNLDLILPLSGFLSSGTYLYAGPRYTRFVANFKYVGGNEDFDVRSNQWGIGAGLGSQFSISPKFALVVSTGVDYLAEAELRGHDTSYSPDGQTGNERDDYTFADADEAIDQPNVELRLMLGLRYSLR